MTTATQVLRQEHDAILRMLEATEEAARQLAAGEHLEPRILDGLLEFFRLFADRCHHGKEEDLLFPKLQEKGMPRNMGPIGVMLIEHDQGRALVRQMQQAALEYQQGRSGAASRWAEAARGYIALLREHIYKENQILFVMAERMLTDEEQRELSARFEVVEEEKMGAGTHQRLHALMEQLWNEIWKVNAAAR
ncbi:MAG TPA: hemerythrin domain-containing protein [Candidatus Nitrosotenuis sp.]|nr:hemerythrin domain-containing protein [Candidatus Nitrosotenuis sp.]